MVSCENVGWLPCRSAHLDTLLEAMLNRQLINLVYHAGQKAGNIHLARFDPIQQEQMVLRFIDEHGSIKLADVMELCRLSAPQAYHFLKRLEKSKKIEYHRVKRYAYYTLPT